MLRSSHPLLQQLCTLDRFGTVDKFHLARGKDLTQACGGYRGERKQDHPHAHNQPGTPRTCAGQRARERGLSHSRGSSRRRGIHAPTSELAILPSSPCFVNHHPGSVSLILPQLPWLRASVSVSLCRMGPATDWAYGNSRGEGGRGTRNPHLGRSLYSRW